jgi:hypothetical protein
LFSWFCPWLVPWQFSFLAWLCGHFQPSRFAFSFGGDEMSGLFVFLSRVGFVLFMPFALLFLLASFLFGVLFSLLDFDSGVRS